MMQVSNKQQLESIMVTIDKHLTTWGGGPCDQIKIIAAPKDWITNADKKKWVAIDESLKNVIQ